MILKYLSHRMVATDVLGAYAAVATRLLALPLLLCSVGSSSRSKGASQAWEYTAHSGNNVHRHCHVAVGTSYRSLPARAQWSDPDRLAIKIIATS